MLQVVLHFNGTQLLQQLLLPHDACLALCNVRARANRGLGNDSTSDAAMMQETRHIARRVVICHDALQVLDGELFWACEKVSSAWTKDEVTVTTGAFHAGPQVSL